MTRIVPASKVLLFSFFIAVIMIGSLLLILPDMWRGRGDSLLDVLFTSVSAVLRPASSL